MPEASPPESAFGETSDLSVLSVPLVDLAAHIAATFGQDIQDPSVAHIALQAARSRRFAVILMLEQEKEIRALMVGGVDYHTAVKQRLSHEGSNGKLVEQSIIDLTKRADDAESQLKAREDRRRQRQPRLDASKASAHLRAIAKIPRSM